MDCLLKYRRLVQKRGETWAGARKRPAWYNPLAFDLTDNSILPAIIHVDFDVCTIIFRDIPRSLALCPLGFVPQELPLLVSCHTTNLGTPKFDTISLVIMLDPPGRVVRQVGSTAAHDCVKRVLSEPGFVSCASPGIEGARFEAGRRGCYELALVRQALVEEVKENVWRTLDWCRSEDEDCKQRKSKPMIDPSLVCQHGDLPMPTYAKATKRGMASKDMMPACFEGVE